MIRWSINISLLFGERPFLERFQAANAAGFGAVEFHWPSGINKDSLVAAKEAAGVEVVLLNMDAGDLAQGERGYPNDPDRIDWWRERAQVAFEFAQRLNASRINVLAGNQIGGLSRNEMLACLIENLTWAIPRAEASGLTLLLEPLNHFSNPSYMLRRTADALEVIEQVDNPRLKLQFDVFHTQRSEGNLVHLLAQHAAHIGHIQIADSPARHQPGTGEINWRFVFREIEELAFAGYVGLEYDPLPNSLDSLRWLPASQRRECTAEDLSF